MVMTVNEFYLFIRNKLKEHNIPDAEFEAKELCCHWLKIDPHDFLLRRGTDIPFVPDNFTKELSERICGKPLQYILGKWEFYGLPFKVGEGVLIPRPETELIVDLAAKHCGCCSRVLDLCSGSGCIPISISKVTGAKATAVELSPEAYTYLLYNISLNEVKSLVTPVNADVLRKNVVEGFYDMITSNPPYLTKQDMAELQAEVRREPEMALYGGEDGLDFYRKLFKLYAPHLKEKGVFAVEIGVGQEEQVSAFMKDAGLDTAVITDLNGIKRVVYGIKM